MTRKPAKPQPEPDSATPAATQSWSARIAGIVVVQIAFNAVAALLLLLGALLLETLGMRFGLNLLIPLIGVQFLVFPGLVYWLLQRLGLIHGKQAPPGFWYGMALGFALLIWVFPSMPYSQDAWRLYRAIELTAHDVATVRQQGDAPVVFRLPGFQLAYRPRGQYMRRTRSDDGQVSRTYYSVVPLLAAETSTNQGLWLGWEGSPRNNPPATHYRLNPWNNIEYRLAVADALGTDAPTDTLILERSLPLAAARAEVWGWLGFGWKLANGLSLGALVVVSIGIGIRRLRRG